MCYGFLEKSSWTELFSKIDKIAWTLSWQLSLSVSDSALSLELHESLELALEVVEFIVDLDSEVLQFEFGILIANLWFSGPNSDRALYLINTVSERPSSTSVSVGILFLNS